MCKENDRIGNVQTTLIRWYKQHFWEEHVRSKIVWYIEMQAMQEISNYFLCEQGKESIPAHFLEKETSFCYIEN